MTSLPSAVAARVVLDRDVAASYAVDASMRSTAPESFTVVRARDLSDVVAVLEHASATGTPVVPQGARTSLAGGATASEGAIVLNVEGIDGIRDIDVVEGHAVVGPGVVTADLKQEAARAGLFYPPDPASSATCTVGGNVATNAGGLCSIKYGVTADYVKALQVVLPGGEVMRTGHRTAKGVAGYDLTGLVVGSEGTLGVVTEVMVRLLPAPDPSLTALATFDSLDAAVAGIVALRRDPHRPSLLEILDRATVAALQDLADFGFPRDCEAVLLVQSDRPGHADEDVARFAGLLTAAGASEVAAADDEQEAEALMAGRRALYPAFERKGPRLAEDICVPVGRLADFIRAGQEVSSRTGVEILLSGHGGDGNLHPSFFFTAGDPDSLHRAEAAFGELVGIGLSLGGTITGEHGVGTLKAPWLERELGAAEVRRQRRVKALFDPQGIMNPGKVFGP
ncbi:MAG TPA: FAD-linked oxidase C-terminal domain-containing protein [Intrasporangium sp.]|uniref:FAD-binding oxidoreductase n=1 Tax=Intrasporangium sp. TaxID=1925024 RepID=UPI002D76A0DA|nr:FAD-linked oxidase C-terminal domain-containing protein [Intrasporangium sp.]HET7397892.1 FAD-linked oxidase C-terminal domain-containing protein [Intrasporangium sp.]